MNNGKVVKVYNVPSPAREKGHPDAAPVRMPAPEWPVRKEEDRPIRIIIPDREPAKVG